MAGLVDGVSGARLDPAAEAEIRYLEAMIARLEAGRKTPRTSGSSGSKTASTASGAAPSTT